MTNFRKGQIHPITAQCKYCKNLFQAQSRKKKVCHDCRSKHKREYTNKKNAEKRKLKCLKNIQN